MAKTVKAQLRTGYNSGIVSVYKTDVTSSSTARAIMEDLLGLHPDCIVSFDLQDCDRVLRIEDPRQSILEHNVVSILQQFGHRLEILQ